MEDEAMTIGPQAPAAAGNACVTAALPVSRMAESALSPTGQESQTRDTRSGTESGSALRFSQRGTVDADRVALMAQAAEESIHQGLVSQEVGPFFVVQVCSDDCGLPPISLLHELEENVGLLGF